MKNVYGIGITALSVIALLQILAHYASVIRFRSHIKLFWVHFLWSVGCLLGVLQFIEAFWRFYPLTTTSGFVMTSIATMPLFWIVLVQITYPVYHSKDFVNEETLDLQTHYFKVKTKSYGLWVVVILLYFWISSFLMNDGFWHLKNIFRFSYLIVALILTFENVENIQYKTALHGGLMSYSLLKFVAFIILFSEKIR